MGIQRVRQYQSFGMLDDPQSWIRKHLSDHAAEASLRIQDFDHNRLANLHQGVTTTDSPGFVGLTLSGLTAARPVFTDANKALVSATFGTANQMLGMNAAANMLEYKSLTGTANRVTVTHGVETITLSGPQDIATTSSPTFAGLTLTGFSGAVQAATGVLSSGTLPVGSGGTGLTVYAVGDLLYANATTTLAKLAAVATGSYLASGGVNTAPAWATLNQAAVAGLTTSDSPVFATVKCSGLTDGYVPYHVADATGLANSAIQSTAADIGLGEAPTTNIRMTIRATAASEATLGDTILTNGDFATNDLTGWTAAAGWSAATGKAVHNGGIGDTTPLVQAVSLTNAKVYEVVVTTSDRTTGTLTLTFGSLEGSYSVGVNDTDKKTFTATSTAAFNLTFTPSATFNGAVDNITVKLVTANATPIMTIKDTTGTSIASIRGSNSLNNFGFGDSALIYITTGIHNFALGYQSLYSLTTGGYNFALGYQSLSGLTTGIYNFASGYGSLYNLTRGNYNFALGYLSLYNLVSGVGNLALGYKAGRGMTTTNVPVTDTYGILIGYAANRSVVSATELTNYIGIGYGTLIDKSNQVKIGNSSIVETDLYGALALIGTPDVVSAAGAISVTTPITHIVTNGVGTVLTLAAGVEGQIKYIVLKTLTSGGDTDVITPTGGGAGYTTITMDAVGDAVTLLYTNAKWTVTGSFACAIA